jgi:glycosyltransferase involved in cell wall biosynthesis
MAASSGPLVFDASDLLDYFRSNRAPTGIQRVQLNLIGGALDRVQDATVVVFDPTAGVWKPLPAETFRRLAELSRSGAAAEDPAWASAVAGAVGALLRAPAVGFAAASRLVNLGTSWWLPDYLRRVREAKARHGLRYIPFLHDCIPLVVPEHCAAGLVDEFARWFAGVSVLADKVLCNSACTEADFRRLRARLLPEGSAPIPTAVLRLDAAPTPAAGEGGVTPPPLPLRSGRPYVLFVGTLEARKNHLMVFNAWLALLRRHGAEAVPDLVCVGKRGWLAEAALALHANSAALRERVHLLHDVPDTALEALYRGCLFTLYNSFYEGWGLPVTESLAYGKVPLIPGHSSLREAGGPAAVTFEPQNEPDLLAKLERLAFDVVFRAAQESRIAEEVRLRSWGEIADEMLRAVEAEALPAPPPPGTAAPSPPLGTIHAVALHPGPEPTLAMVLADALRDGPAWSVLEPWGAWTLPGTARLRVPVPPGTAGPLRLHLDLVGPSQPQRIGLRAAATPGRAPAPYKPVEIGPGERVVCVVEALEVSADGSVAVEIDCSEGVQVGGDGPTPDVRLVGVGVRSVMVCRTDDVAARLDWLERMALPRLVRA